MRLRAAFFLLVFHLSAFALDALKDSGINRGLCVMLPARDAGEIAAFTCDGNMLVHGLVRDDADLRRLREALEAQGIYGLATVTRPVHLKFLPYADNLVNLLVCDLDALGVEAPTHAEILRVVAPNGVAYLRKASAWTKHVKPRPQESDDWTHFDYNASGSGVSRDKLVQPPDAVQWRMELEPYTGLGGNPAGYRPYTSYRLSGGRAFFALKLTTEEDKSKTPPVFLMARDAYNGLPLWKVPQVSPGPGTPQEYQLVVNDTRVFTFLKRGTFPVSLDAATGNVVTVFENGARSPEKNIHPGYFMLRATNRVLLQCSEDKLYALDANDGALRWLYHDTQGFVCFPRIDEAHNRVIVHIVERDAQKIQTRWANLKTMAIVCLALDSGKELWRCTEVENLNIGQTVPADDSIYLFNPGGIGASDSWNKFDGGIVAKLNAANGKLLWKSERFKWGYNLIVKNGIPYFATPSELNRLDPATGAISASWKAAFNNRCNRTSATENWIIMGMGNFVNHEGVATVKGIARGGCAQGVIPGNGLLYYTPNTCHCITMLRGHLALSAEPLREPVPDEARLEKGGAFPTAANAKPASMSGPITSEWLPQIWYGASETVPVTDGARTYVSVIHAHRIECRENGKVLWSFTAGGRVTQPPVLAGGNCYFGAHDGYLYSVNAANGALQWRFLAAPYERYIVSHGQLESSWPVYNAVMHNGEICCSSGLHSETGGGIHVWGLDPVTGNLKWHKRLKRSELPVKPGGKIAPNRVMNSPLQSDGQQLSIMGISFTPHDSEADINARIDAGSMGDKNRNWSWSLRGPMIQEKK